MIIISSTEYPPLPKHLAVVQLAWDSHPLRTASTDLRLADIRLVIEAGERYGLDVSNHPRFSLRIAPDSPYQDGPLAPAASHEFAHLIDRFDEAFILDKSPLEAHSIIEDLPQGNANESVKRAFFTYWNAYIDGRLERRGIHVDTLQNRMAEKLGRRGKVGTVAPEERASLERIWHTEPHTMDELIALAQAYPYRRPSQYWIEYPVGGA
jgi:hypothetical protein